MHKRFHQNHQFWEIWFQDFQIQNKHILKSYIIQSVKIFILCMYLVKYINYRKISEYFNVYKRNTLKTGSAYFPSSLLFQKGIKPVCHTLIKLKILIQKLLSSHISSQNPTFKLAILDKSIYDYDNYKYVYLRREMLRLSAHIIEIWSHTTSLLAKIL